MRAQPVLILTALLLLAAPAVAGAAYFQSEVVDANLIQRVGDADLANDGSGAVAYVRNDGGTDHIFVARLVNGAFQPPERVDGPLTAAGSQPAVAASDGGRVTAVFVNGTGVYAAVRAAGATSFSSPQLLSANGNSPSVDMSIFGVAYASYTAAGAGGGDINVARLDRTATTYTPVPGAVDFAAANDAGSGLGRSHIATSADATAVVVWGEAGHVFSRRIYGDRLSTAPQDLTVASLGGLTGGAADSPWIDIEDDSSYAWAVFREQFSDGMTHVIARRLVGSQFEAPVDVAAGDAATTARVEVNGRGEGVISAGVGPFGAFVSLIHEDTPFAGSTVSGSNLVAPQTVGAESENNDAFASWFEGALGSATVHGVSYDVNLANHTVPGPTGALQLSTPGFGPADPAAGLELAADRAGDMLVAFVQSDGTTRRLVAAGFDHPPGAFVANTTTGWRKYSRPPLSWGASLELWGVTYQVQIDNQVVATTTATSIKAPAAPAKLTDGTHNWRVIAIDHHGQQTATPLRVLRVDTAKPAVDVKITGKRKAGKLVKVKAKVADGSLTAPSGSGIKVVSISFGDGTVAHSRTASHKFRRGTYTVRVRATDKAGNVTQLAHKVRIKK